MSDETDKLIANKWKDRGSCVLHCFITLEKFPPILIYLYNQFNDPFKKQKGFSKAEAIFNEVYLL